MKNQKILIGGQALRQLGSDRYTNDTDYLINDKSTSEAFITSDKVDFINANGNDFFMKVWNLEKNNNSEIASPQALLELKAYSLVQHCQNMNWAKADATEYDIKFLVRTFKLTTIKIANKFISNGELFEVNKIINSVKF
ncbi:MAG: hypothetical protein GY849_02465 [Deltaproteobacteria bacterium]|nr:hypothetical protein [Deltaproteobacteria bacterium]